ncbi:MAG TPA: hypothetical protein VMQ99_14990 [Acetobacteraceae bacterium]|jgi:hypothetical protein|nr:hypothetical protein [Acetobacteraceae bacterium]
MFLTRHCTAALGTAALAVLAACVSAAPVDAQPPSRAPAITCTNPVSGTAWQISIDYDAAMVDSYPAQISDGEISWHDAKDGGNYTLDRRSGNLTVIVASSTGGYFLHDHCRLPP